MNIVFHPRVFSEVDLIMRYYEEVAGSNLADEFYEEFRNCVRLAANSPQLFSEKNEGVPVERLAAIAIAQAVGAWGIQRSDFEARAIRGNRKKFERVLAKVPDVEPEHEWDRLPQK